MVQLKPTFDTKQFNFQSDNIQFHCYILDLKNSLFLWIGDATQTLDSLAIALQTSQTSDESKSGTTCSTLMGNVLDSYNENLCRKLSSKLKKPVLLSLNMEIQPDQTPLFEKSLIAKLSDVL